MDRLLALLALLLVAPVLLACAMAVRRDGGPALRRRRYMGRAGREFTMLTFRTEALDSVATTPVGRRLQRLCLDELPQLLNVVGGSMALVGPRPSAPGTRADDRTSRRLLKPGLTGLWLMDHDDAAAYDDRGAGPEVRYVMRWTPARDIRILAGTLRTALSRRTP